MLQQLSKLFALPVHLSRQVSHLGVIAVLFSAKVQSFKELECAMEYDKEDLQKDSGPLTALWDFGFVVGCPH